MHLICKRGCVGQRGWARFKTHWLPLVGRLAARGMIKPAPVNGQSACSSHVNPCSHQLLRWPVIDIDQKQFQLIRGCAYWWQRIDYRLTGKMVACRGEVLLALHQAVHQQGPGLVTFNSVAEQEEQSSLVVKNGLCADWYVISCVGAKKLKAGGKRKQTQHV